MPCSSGHGVYGPVRVTRHGLVARSEPEPHRRWSTCSPSAGRFILCMAFAWRRQRCWWRGSKKQSEAMTHSRRCRLRESILEQEAALAMAWAKIVQIDMEPSPIRTKTAGHLCVRG